MPPSVPASAWTQSAFPLRLLWCCVLCRVAVFAAPDAPRSFDVPPDTADKSLKRFSEQAGLEVIFSTRLTRDVKTKPVKGPMTAHQALDAMLADTGLIVIRDEKTGAFTVSRAASGNKTTPKADDGRQSGTGNGSAASIPDPQPAKKKTDTMKPKKNPIALLGAWLAIALAPGQAAEPADSATPPKPDDKAIVLSPFTVNSDKDNGYQAASTLAGTRLNTPIKDLGASISVYTKDFLNDLATNNVNELLVFGTGTEAGGSQGNYSGASGNINDTQVHGNGVRSDPQGATRIRGLGTPNFTRGYFATSIPTDFYNVDAVTVNRGPNSILFGAGNPAGVVDTAMITADPDRDSNHVLFRYGNNDSVRSSIDLNRVLLPKMLAMRLAAVDDNERFNQRPAYEHKRRVFGAVTATPFSSTTVRGSFETGNTRANRPLTVLPQDSISKEWYAAGRPVFDWTFHDDPARNPNAAADVKNMGFGFSGPEVSGSPGHLSSFNSIFDRLVYVYPEANSTTVNYGFRGQLNFTSPSAPFAVNSVRSGLFHPLVNRDSAPEANGNTIATRNIGEVNPAFFPDGRRPAGLKFQGFTNFDAFDFKNQLFDQIGGQSENFHTFNFAVEQLAWKKRLGIELAYNRERFDRFANNGFMTFTGNGAVRIDTNVTRLDGRPNPNVGRPYVSFLPAFARSHSDRESARATGFVRYDFKDVSPRLGKWLGRHTLTGLYDKSSQEFIAYENSFYDTGSLADSMGPTLTAGARKPFAQVYVGKSVLDGSALRLNPITVSAPFNGMTYQATYFNAPAGSTAQGDFATAPVRLQEAINSGSGSRTVIKSKAFVLQSHWLDEHLVTTLGWRRDEGFFQSTTIVAGPTFEQTRWGFRDFVFDSTPPPRGSKEVKSGSAVLRWPQKLARLPFGLDASVFVNTAENFTPASGRVNLYNQPLGSPEGKTKEAGLNLSFMENRFNLRVNRFETSGQSASIASEALNRIVSNILFGAGNPLWVSDPTVNRLAEVDKMFAALPANVKADWKWTVTGDFVPGVPGSRTATSAPLPGLTDTTDFTAKGYEAEFTFNPSRQWRFLLNVAKQETVQTNVAPVTRELIARLKPVWDTQAALPHGLYPTTFPGVPLSPSVDLRGPYLETFVYTPMRQILAGEGTASAEQRKWRANLVGNYTFARESRFRGWSGGGGVRWQDKLGIGYPASYAADGRAYSDLKRPYYAPAETNVDLFAGYARKIWNNRIEWKAQLNVRNAIGKGSPIGVTAQPTGEIAVARLAPERRWYLTNTFSF
ncbi:MAG: TonB-dependent receptor plug domain-containing protein [Opitutaceae bacterium]|nr:TonB-dependent receptor plug domain-containing protein [Opitutaceae bacterium]